MEKLNLTGKSKHSSDDALRGLSAVFVDGERVFIDNGAIHAKSNLERGLTFVKNREEVPNPRDVWVFWITLRRGPDGQGYHGAMPFRLWVDEAAGVGFKSLAEQVNKMEKAVKGQVDLTGVPDEVVARVGGFLKQLRPDLWDHAGEAFRTAFAAPSQPES
ncbi:YwhD family protein [Alicyclobacillus macrosporangiidus]|uniref:YwhD family protein n=1 Tax=Alicyclobacillus macrosporangiidus TaxID=392015 RepID=A0A1I7FRD4_9BACL|nr:YwhD family protein [Alicyclobacillus macrosporangiidus]SFU38784.1 YwhD family protein [Alicyclobacillus macrosporangiidus]